MARPTREEKALNLRQWRFVESYLLEPNSQQAAIRAGYSPKTAGTSGSALLKNPKIQAALAQRMRAVQNKTNIDAGWVLKRAAMLADFNIKKFIRLDDSGRAVYDFSTATDDDWYCIAEYVRDDTYIAAKEEGLIPVTKIRLKAFDKLAALKLVGQHIDVSAFSEQVEVKAKIEVTDVSMTEAARRIAYTLAEGMREAGSK